MLEGRKICIPNQDGNQTHVFILCPLQKSHMLCVSCYMWRNWGSLKLVVLINIIKMPKGSQQLKSEVRASTISFFDKLILASWWGNVTQQLWFCYTAGCGLHISHSSKAGDHVRCNCLSSVSVFLTPPIRNAPQASTFFYQGNIRKMWMLPVLHSYKAHEVTGIQCPDSCLWQMLSLTSQNGLFKHLDTLPYFMIVWTWRGKMRASSVIDCFSRMCQALALIQSNEKWEREWETDKVGEREAGWEKEEEKEKEGGKKGRIWMALEKHADLVTYLEN